MLPALRHPLHGSLSTLCFAALSDGQTAIAEHRAIRKPVPLKVYAGMLLDLLMSGARRNLENLLLNRVEFGGGQSGRRQQRLALIFRHADKNVTAAQIGESAHRVKDGLGVPSHLQFQTFPFDGLGVQDRLGASMTGR